MQATDLPKDWHSQLPAVEEQYPGGNQQQGMAAMIEGEGVVELGGWRGRTQPGPLRDTLGQPWWIRRREGQGV
jgi:hypothetical protein